MGNLNLADSKNFFTKTPIVGTYADKKFDDLSAFFNCKLLPTGVRVCQGDVIDSIEMLYDKMDYKKSASPFFHGGANGYSRDFIFPVGDFLRKIEVEYGKYSFSTDATQRNKDVIVRIRFTTQSGAQSPWYGNSCGKGSRMVVTPYTLDVGANSIICCFYGAIGKDNMVLHNYLQAIGGYSISFLDARRFALIK